MSEKISQLIDQELDSDHQKIVIDHMIKNKAACKAWQNYHLIGAIMRDEIQQSGADLSERVYSAIDAEPTVLSPNKITNVKDGKAKNSEKSDVWKSVGLFAIAASLAIVAVVSLNPVDTQNQNDTIAANQQTESEQVAKFAQEFDEMLVEHSEFTSSSGLNGLLAYAKLVSSQPLKQ